MLSIIVAMASNNVIGKNNKLLWHLPADLERFKKITINHDIIMGRKTFDSLDFILPQRKHIVFSKSGKLNKEGANVEIVNDINALEKYMQSSKETFLIGSGQLYKQLMPYATKLYITRIYHEFEGDIYFPKIDEKSWKLISREKGIRNDENPFDYEYLIYEKI